MQTPSIMRRYGQADVRAAFAGMLGYAGDPSESPMESGPARCRRVSDLVLRLPASGI